MRAHLDVGDKSRSFSISELFSAFVQLAYNTLNIVICIDSQRGHLQSLCARFPDLVSRCNVNWLQEWPMETMKDIATQVNTNPVSLIEKTYKQAMQHTPKH